MKTKTILIIVGVVIVVAAIVFFFTKKKIAANFTITPRQSGQVPAGTDDGSNIPAAPVNQNKVLDKQTKNAKTEIAVLQKMLQALGYNVPFNGVFDDATEAAVKALTGKVQTTVKEIRYTYYNPDFGEDSAAALIKDANNGFKSQMFS